MSPDRLFMVAVRSVSFDHAEVFPHPVLLENRELCCIVQHNFPPHMAQLLKYKRMTVNVPLDLATAIQNRIKECPYSSESAYFLGLAIFDLWSYRQHKLTVPLMAQPPAVRDGAIARIGADYLAGKRGRNEPGWFEKYIKEIVDEELVKAGLPKTPDLDSQP
jgi:hypothetical protein